MFTRFLYIVLFLGLICSCKNKSENFNLTNNSIPVIGYRYIKSYPHDTTSFTEGFLINEGRLYESTGSPKGLTYTNSLFGDVDFETGTINVKVTLDKEKYFGEGITFLNDKVFQLTYKKQIGFVYNAKTFKKIKEFSLPCKEGWGLTTDGESLIMSDGTNQLTFINPETLDVTKTLRVTENGNAKENLNELEYINGYIYANIWTTSTIVKIDPKDGNVVGILDLKDLSLEANWLYSKSLEMNGIAYDSVSNKVYITGKLWPKIYEIELLN